MKKTDDVAFFYIFIVERCGCWLILLLLSNSSTISFICETTTVLELFFERRFLHHVNLQNTFQDLKRLLCKYVCNMCFLISATGHHFGKLQQQRPIQQEERALKEGSCSGGIGGDCYSELPGEGRKDCKGKSVSEGRTDCCCGGCPQARYIENTYCKSVWFLACSECFSR